MTNKIVKMLQNAFSTIFYLEATNWEDLQISMERVSFPGVLDPTWRNNDLGLGGTTFSCLGFSLNDYITFSMQTKHSMRLMQNILPHIHYTLPSNDAGKKIKFKLDVVAAGEQGEFVVPPGSPFEREYTLLGNEANRHNVLPLDLVPPVNNTLDTIYKCRATRVAASSDDYPGEVYVESIDSHVMLDSVGSGRVLAK